MATAWDDATEWLSVAPVEALVPPKGLDPGVDEWLDIADMEVVRPYIVPARCASTARY